jgi:hypothetical protein
VSKAIRTDSPQPLIVVETDPDAEPVDLDRLDAALAELLLAMAGRKND